MLLETTGSRVTEAEDRQLLDRLAAVEPRLAPLDESLILECVERVLKVYTDMLLLELDLDG